MSPHCATAPAHSQRGVSLLIVLILLVTSSLLGAAVLRSTLLEERMSANLYDRSLAFQSAESALRTAEKQIQATVRADAITGFDCSRPDSNCSVVPENTYTGNNAGCAEYARDCWITDHTANQVLQVDHPQYHIQYLGHRQSAQQPESGEVIEFVYRVLARSHNPGSRTERSLAVLTTSIVVRTSTPPAMAEVRRVLWRELIRE